MDSLVINVMKIRKDFSKISVNEVKKRFKCFFKNLKSLIYMMFANKIV